jgi:hypothetical protein
MLLLGLPRKSICYGKKQVLSLFSVALTFLCRGIYICSAQIVHICMQVFLAGRVNLHGRLFFTFRQIRISVRIVYYVVSLPRPSEDSQVFNDAELIKLVS